MSDLDRTALIGGPYRMPRCRAGSVLFDVGHGDVEVAGITSAPVPWPYRAAPGGKVALVFQRDLCRAVRVESVTAICHHWGVSRSTVMRWRRHLGVGRWTPGTRRLWSVLWPVRLGVEGARAGGRATAGIPRRRRA